MSSPSVPTTTATASGGDAEDSPARRSVAGEMPPDVCLNVFALPSRTNILFALIILVIALPVVASLAADSPLRAPLLLICLLTLPLRAFLRLPDEEWFRARLTAPGERFSHLARRVEQLISRVGLAHRPRLLVSEESGATPRATGSFTRPMLIVPIAQAQRMQKQMHADGADDSVDAAALEDIALDRQAADAVLYHELAHFKNNDVVSVFFSASVLKTAIGFVTFSLLVTLMTPWMYNSLIRFFDVAALFPPPVLSMIEEMDPRVAEVIRNPPQVGWQTWLRYEMFVFSAHWPLILGALLLLVLFLPALKRTREFYADARVAHWQGTDDALYDALVGSMIEAAVGQSGRPAAGAHPARFLGIRSPSPAKDAWDDASRSFRRIARWLRAMLSSHPDLTTRLRCLAAPQRVYGDVWDIGFVAGFAVVLLNLTLASVFLSRLVRSPNAVVPFVLGFTILSVSYLPAVCVWRGRTRDLWRRLSRSVGLFTFIKLVPQFALAAIAIAAIVTIPGAVTQAAYGISGVGGENLPPIAVSLEFIVEMYAIRPAILFAFVMPLTLLAFLLLDARLKRLALTWYRATFLARYSVVVFWGLTVWLALALWFVVLPFYNVAAAPTAHSLDDPAVLTPMALTLAASLVLAAFFAVGHRRYARRCPTCHEHVAGYYHVGKCCEKCGTLLHPWLVAQYERSASRQFADEESEGVGDERQGAEA